MIKKKKTVKLSESESPHWM